MLGSLTDFIEVEGQEQKQYQSIKQDNQQIQPISALTKNNRKNALQLRKKRTMSGVQTYKATDKQLLFKKFTQNYPHIEAVKKNTLKLILTETKPSRKSIAESKLSSLFYGQSPSKMNGNIIKDKYGGLHFKMYNEIAQDELRRQHNLLRAIVRTKKNDQQKITNTHYEDSYNRMSSALKNIKIKQIAQVQVNFQNKQQNTNRSLQMPKQKRRDSRINNRTRLQFQNCLSWSKKRRKDGSFYAQRLGKKVVVEQSQHKNVQNRKSMLQFIHKRSNSENIPVKID